MLTKRDDNRLLIKAPDLFAQIHLELTAKHYPSIDIAKVTHGSVKKLWWECSHGHQWEARVDHRYRTRNCPYCVNKKKKVGYNTLPDTHNHLLNEWDFTKNTHISPTDFIASSTQKVWWKCAAHGHSWEAQIKSRTFGYGCPICANTVIHSGINDFATAYPELVEEWDKAKNTLSPDEVSPKSSRKVWWICKTCDHSWKTWINHRANGKGCLSCSSGKTEKAFVKALSEISGHEFKSTFITAQRQLFKSNRIQIDGLCEELSIVLEYDGEWTHGTNNPQGKPYQERLDEDADTTEVLLNHGYKVIRIREAPLDFVILNGQNLRHENLKENLFQVSYYSSKESIKEIVNTVYKDNFAWFHNN